MAGGPKRDYGVAETEVGRRSWQCRRSELNHDELGNRFIVALDGQLAFLAGGASDPMKSRVFVQEQLPRWPSLYSGFVALLDDFEREMSPQTMFEWGALGRVQVSVREWLAPLVHELWRARLSTEGLLRDAKKSLCRADGEYRLLRGRIDASSSSDSETMKSLRPDIERLASACRELVSTIHRFPRDIRVV